MGDAIDAFEEPTDGAKGSDLVLKSGGRLHADLVILGLGVRAESKLAKEAGLEVSVRGGIVVDDFLRTTDPHVWAVGDAIEVKNPTLGDSWMILWRGRRISRAAWWLIISALLPARCATTVGPSEPLCSAASQTPAPELGTTGARSRAGVCLTKPLTCGRAYTLGTTPVTL